jgi:hypothetical protein
MDRRSFMTGIAATVASVGLSGPATAALPLWELLGRKSVSLFIDRDTIFVGQHRGAFRKIRLKVLGASLTLLDLDVYFANGQVQDVATRTHIPAGGQTRIIDLAGDARFISKVKLVYQRPIFFLPTVVELWGRH